MSMQSISVRAAGPNDFDLIIAFNQAMAEETEGKTLEPATIQAGVRKALEDPARCMYFVASIDGKVVGQTMVTFEWSDWRNGWFWWIQSVYVDAESRRCGVFRALYDHIRDLAKSHPDVCGLRLYVVKQNTRAIETYQNLGMTQTDYVLCEEEWPPSSPSSTATVMER